METTRTNVFLVEDSALIRTRLTAMLNDMRGVAVVGEAETPESAIEGILRTRPDSVVLDIQLIGGSGIEVLRKVRAVDPGIVFIMLTNHVHPQYRATCLEAGADYFLDKSNEILNLTKIIAGLGRTRQRPAARQSS